MLAVSSTIATVLVLAVTIAIAVAVVGYINGLWGTTLSGREVLLPMPDGYINVSDRDFLGRERVSLHLHVVNKDGDTVVDKIVIPSLGVSARYFYLLDDDATLKEAYTITGNALTRLIPAGKDAWLVIDLGPPSSVNAVPGTLYVVEIYTKNGNVFKVNVQAKS